MKEKGTRDSTLMSETVDGCKEGVNSKAYVDEPCTEAVLVHVLLQSKP